MAFSTAGKNAMLNALGAIITHVGVLDADAGKAVTGVASTDTFTSAAHGYSNGDIALLSALTGGAGLLAGRIYYVRDVTTNTFKLALVSGGTAVDFTTDVTVGTITRLVEVSGGSPAYARKAIAFNAAADGFMDDSTNGAVIDVPAGTTDDYIGYFSAVTAGTLEAISAPANVETFVGQGTVTVTDADLDLMGTV